MFGIDTIEILCKVKKEKVNDWIHLDAFDRFTKNSEEIKMVIKPSNSTNTLGLVLIPSKDSLKKTKEFIKKHDLEVLAITRIDCARDFNTSIENNYNLYLLFTNCLLKEKGWNKEGIEFYQTLKGIKRKSGNIKITNNWYSLTFYNCEDKRPAKSRMEYRIIFRTIDIKNIELWETVIINEWTKFLNELRNLEKFISKVEADYIRALKELWAEEKKEYASFEEFIKIQDKNGLILTRPILEGLLQSVKPNQKVEDFIREFKRKRKNVLNFVTKHQFNQFILDTKKLIKEDLKNLKK